MQKKALGNSTLEVAPLAFGGNVLGWTDLALSGEQVRKLNAAGA